MFNFCDYKISQAATGGMIFRPLNGKIIELRVNEDDSLAHVMAPGTYEVGSILVDSYQKTIYINNCDLNPIVILDEYQGTKAILNNIVVTADPNPKQTAARQIMQDKQEAAKEVDDKNSFV